MKIIEKFQKGKRTADTCEDGIVTTDDFAAVIDGSTSKGNLRWNGKTSGRMAMELLTVAIAGLSAEATAGEALTCLTECIHGFYIRHDMWDEAQRKAENRLTASAVIYSRYRREIWMFGDCLCRFNGKTYTHPKAVDAILAQARADIIGFLLKKGHSIESLRERDLAREWIFPYLKEQCYFQNATDAGPYAYAVLDGFTVPSSAIKVLSVPCGTKELILASDGYPCLEDTLDATELRLSELLARDPLCYQELKSTKGMIKGNVSFDDRTYLRLSLIE